jgi:DNA modification methylase
MEDGKVGKASSSSISLSGIIERPPGDLKPYASNPRRHPATQLKRIEASMRMFGCTNPVLVNESGVILSGHGRVLSALAMGLATVPTRVISGLSAAQMRAYVIGDNKIALLSSWDVSLLRTELELLIEDDIAIEYTAFDTAEIDLLIDPELNGGKADDDDLQPADCAGPVTSRVGDLWQLAQHRLLCGDALDRRSYETVMGGDTAQMVITDPPYNVPIDGHVCGSGKVKHAEFVMGAGEMSQAEFVDFLRRAITNMAAVSQEGAIHFLFIDWRHIAELLAAAVPVFGALKQMCVWTKDNAGLGTFYRSQHELVFVFKKGNAPHINNFGLGKQGRYRTNVWPYPGVNTFKGKGYELLAMHPTVKPTALIADAIRDCSHRKGIVLDPFAGSGTILMAAERTGRYARAIELDPKYVDVAIQRWQRVTGRVAVLAATGQPWDQVRAERLCRTAEGDGNDL